MRSEKGGNVRNDALEKATKSTKVEIKSSTETIF